MDRSPSRRQGQGRPLRGFRQAVANGIAYLPRDRRATGIFPSMSVLDNFAIAAVWTDTTAVQADYSGQASRKALRGHYRRSFRSRFGSRRPDHHAVGRQSAKGTSRASPGASPRRTPPERSSARCRAATATCSTASFVKLAADGMTLVILSSEIEEILLLCGRLLVFQNAKSRPRWPALKPTAGSVISAMFGKAA